MTSKTYEKSPYGPIISDRQIRPLFELCSDEGGIQTGPFGSQLHSSDYVSEGVPIITVEHLGENLIEGQLAPLVDQADVVRLKRYTLRTGDIVFSRVGSVDRRALVTAKEDGWMFSGRLLRVRPNHNLVDSAYLSYFFGLPGFKNYIRSIAVGATMPSLNTELLSNIPIVLPEIKEQQAIARILTCLDAKIQANTALSTTLEEIAQATFRSWFIDFDPVKAKTAGEKPTGMDAETAALFPDCSEESEIGLIPQGWEVKSLDGIAEYLNGLAMQKFPVVEGNQQLPVIKIAQLRAGTTKGADQASGLLDPKYVVKDSDILFSWSGTLEIEIWAGGPGALNQHLFKVTGTTSPNWFAYLATKNFLPNFRQIANGKATTMGHIQRRHLTESRLAFPPSKLIEAAGAIIEPLLSMKLNALVENRRLAELRDSLLPRLISGELRIPEELLVF